MLIHKFINFLYDWNCRMMDNPNAQNKYRIRGLK